MLFSTLKFTQQMKYYSTVELLFIRNIKLLNKPREVKILSNFYEDNMCGNSSTTNEKKKGKYFVSEWNYIKS